MDSKRGSVLVQATLCTTETEALPQNRERGGAMASESRINVRRAKGEGEELPMQVQGIIA